LFVSGCRDYSRRQQFSLSFETKAGISVKALATPTENGADFGLGAPPITFACELLFL